MGTNVCAICGNEITKDDIFIKTADGELVHEHCSIGKLDRCECCHGLILRKKGVRRCKKCEEQIYLSFMNSYGTKPIPQFKNRYGKQNEEYKTRYYGLEMEFNNCNPQKVYELGEKNKLYTDKWIYNKRDGSISYGVEVVTSPLDRKSINVLMKKMQPIFDYVDSKQYHEGAGLHIHVTKKSISIQDRYKLCILLNSSKGQIEKNFMYFLSGRATTPLSAEQSVYDGYFKLGESDRLCPLSCGHGVALNTSNSATYEFRIFKSSNKPEVLLSYVELVDTMIDFVHVNGIKDITISNYINYLKLNSKNKIILDKIEKFESQIGKIKSSRPIIYNNEKMQMLNGVNWKQYYEVLYYISARGYRDMKNIKSRINFKTPREKFTIPKDEFCSKLNKTLRTCLIKEIIRLQSEVEKCA